MTRLLAHLRHQAVAYLALFIALGGTGYAALAIPANSVGSRQLRRGAVTESKLGQRSVGATNLNSKSIAGYVAFWANVGGDGQVFGANPRATVTMPFTGVYHVTWTKHISRRCFVLAGVTNRGPAPASATAEFEGGLKDFKGALVQTFDGTGGGALEPFNVVVICP